MKKIALIFAGGSGQRMGSETPKQFLEIAGKEIIVRTIELFQKNENIDEIYVVSIKSGIKHVKELVNRHNLNKVIKVTAGGKTGQDSIFLGLNEIHKKNDNAIVLIHDGVRPLLEQETITKCIESVGANGSAITVSAMTETPIISMDNRTVSEMPSRSTVYFARAPQCFFLEDIYNAHINERKINPKYDGIVDSCGLMFKHGFVPHLVKGNSDNIKVTTAENLIQLIANYNLRDYSKIIQIINKKHKIGEGKK